MVNENFTGVLENLREARADGQPWHAIGRILRDHVPAGGYQNDFWEKAQEPAELSAVMLKRYMTMLWQLERIAAGHSLDLGGLLSSSFTGTEIAIRIYERKPDAGLKALSDLRQRRVTIDDLRSELKRTPAAHVSSDRGKAIKDRAQIIEHCEVAISAAAPEIFEQGTTVVRRPSLLYFRRVGFEIRNAASEVVSGGDLYPAEPVTRTSDPLEAISQTVLLSQYLPSFWVMFGPRNPEPILRRAHDILAVLAPRIGILCIGEDGTVVVRRRARSAEGARMAEYTELVERFTAPRLGKKK
jgi:hypothetical protein